MPPSSNKDVPSNSVIAGIPAKIICSIEEYYEKNRDRINNTKGMDPREKKDFYVNKFGFQTQ